MQSLDIDFIIEKDKVEGALMAFNIWNRYFHRSLKKVLENLGWVVYETSTNSITIMSLTDEKYKDDEKYFSVLAPYVKEGSYINIKGDDNYWQWYFDGEKLIEKQGRLVFD